MSSIVTKLYNKKLVTPPSFLIDSIQYEVIMGSIAYGVEGDSSDIDIYGFCIPPKEVVFPHLTGEIIGFGKQKKRFEQYEQHHVEDKSRKKEYDITIYNIVRYFHLCMENNPNMIDSLFVPERCVVHITKIGNMVRENRRIFLHAGAWHRFKGYAYSQFHKLSTKEPVGSRKEIIEKYGYDTKFAYHLVRLLNEVEQILVENDIDLERNKEQLKSIKRGEWKLEEVRNYFFEKEKQLEKLFLESKIQRYPDESKIKKLLLNCLEEHYGSLENIIYGG